MMQVIGVQTGCSSSLFNNWRTTIPTPDEVDAYLKEQGR